MAMISCPKCGKEISDKAVKCPACGYELPTVEATTKCEECGQELPEGATSCPNCGCPVKVVENTPQRVSVANVELHHISKKSKENYYRCRDFGYSCYWSHLWHWKIAKFKQNVRIQRKLIEGSK